MTSATCSAYRLRAPCRDPRSAWMPPLASRRLRPAVRTFMASIPAATLDVPQGEPQGVAGRLTRRRRLSASARDSQPRNAESAQSWTLPLSSGGGIRTRDCCPPGALRAACGCRRLARRVLETWQPRAEARGSTCAAEPDRQLPFLDAHDVDVLIGIIDLSHHHEARLFQHAATLGALGRRVSHDATHPGGLARLRHERRDGCGRVPAVPLRLDHGVADLDRPVLIDERATISPTTRSSSERCRT